MANHSEYLIEYDNLNLLVYLSGLDDNGFWDEIAVYDDVNNPEEFAEGLKEGLNAFHEVTVTIGPFIYEDDDEEPVNDPDYYDHVIAKVYG